MELNSEKFFCLCFEHYNVILWISSPGDEVVWTVWCSWFCHPCGSHCTWHGDAWWFKYRECGRQLNYLMEGQAKAVIKDVVCEGHRRPRAKLWGCTLSTVSGTEREGCDYWFLIQEGAKVGEALGEGSDAKELTPSQGVARKGVVKQGCILVEGGLAWCRWVGCRHERAHITPSLGKNTCRYIGRDVVCDLL